MRLASHKYLRANVRLLYEMTCSITVKTISNYSTNLVDLPKFFLFALKEVTGQFQVIQPALDKLLLVPSQLAIGYAGP